MSLEDISAHNGDENDEINVPMALSVFRDGAHNGMTQKRLNSCMFAHVFKARA